MAKKFKPTKIRLKKTDMKQKVFGMPRPLWIAIQWLLILSATIMTLTATLRGTTVQGGIGLALSFMLYCWLVFYKRLPESIVSGFSLLSGLLALPFAVAAARIFVAYFYFRFDKLSQIFVTFLFSNRAAPEAAHLAAVMTVAKSTITVMTGFALWVAAYALIRWIRLALLPAIRSFTGTEIAYLTAATMLSVALVFVVYQQTNLFWYPTRDGQVVLYDAVFTTDTGVLIQTDAFVNLNAAENDLRHPLFGLFVMPFGIIASWAAFFFQGSMAIYALALAFLQVVALLFSMILIARLLRFNDMDQLCFLLLHLISFPALLFILNIEQYVFSLFWLSLYLYSVFHTERETEGWQALAFAGAAGSLLSSGFFILFSSGRGGIRQALLMLLRSLLTFVAVVAAFGQLPLLLEAVESAGRLSRFAAFATDQSSLQANIVQYLTFVRDCFLAPAAGIQNALSPTWQSVPATVPDRIGIVLLALALLGLLLNIKDKYCLLCFSWLLFSACLLVGAGWGAKENGMILYTLYFSWALLSLIYKGFYRILRRLPWLRAGVSLVVFLVVAAVNIRALRELIRFGIAWYPR